MNSQVKARLQSARLQKEDDKLWVKAREVKDATGWNDNRMHKARTLGWVEYKDDPAHGRLYNLRSIAPELLTKTA